MATKAKSVQFRDVKSVVDAYIKQDIPSFAIFHDGQLMFPHETNDIAEGANYLHQLLSKFADSAAIYTIVLYDTLPNDGYIVSTTPYRSSFNFRFSEYNPGMGSIPSNYNNKLEEKVDKLTELVANLYEEREEKDSGSLGVIGSILEIPAVQQVLSGLAAKMLAPSSPAAAMGTIKTEDAKILDKAIQILLKHDPKLPEHLDKLATVAEKEPGKFQMILAGIASL